jgi:hypothetical protein
MANTFTSYVASGVGTTPVALVTVPSATTETIIGLSVANTSASAITFSAYITRSATNYYIINNAMLQTGQTFIMSGGDQKIVLVASDVLNIVTSAASSADAIASVLQMT